MRSLLLLAVLVLVMCGCGTRDNAAAAALADVGVQAAHGLILDAAQRVQDAAVAGQLRAAADLLRGAHQLLAPVQDVLSQGEAVTPPLSPADAAADPARYGDAAGVAAGRAQAEAERLAWWRAWGQRLASLGASAVDNGGWLGGLLAGGGVGSLVLAWAGKLLLDNRRLGKAVGDAVAFGQRALGATTTEEQEQAKSEAAARQDANGTREVIRKHRSRITATEGA